MIVKRFSIIEISVVLLVIMLLMGIGAKFYKTVQRSVMNKNQQIEFDNIKIAINSFKSAIRGTRKPSSKHVSLYDLIYTHHLLSEKRILLINGNDKTKADEQIKSYFDTPIEVYVTKQKIGASAEEIEKGYQQIPKYEFLTGNFEFYTGDDHLNGSEPDVDGDESGAPPIGTPYGIKGNGSKDDRFRYYYKLVYKEYDDGIAHEYYFH